MSRLGFRPSGSLILTFLSLLASQATYSADLETNVMTRADSFVSPAYSATSTNTFGFIGAAANNLDSSDKATPLQVDLGGAFSPQETNLSYVDVRQFYGQMPSLGLAFGRKLQTWSRLDEQWHLGLYQPQFLWNPLLPESQGLTGLFAEFKSSDPASIPLSLRLFASDLYIPNQGASYQIQNGQFTNANPWFSQMPTQIEFGNSVTNQVNYNLHMPDQGSVVFNPSYVGQIMLGQEDKGLQFMGAAAYKPSNQLIMGVTTATTSGGLTNMDIYPELYYHTLASADLRYSLDHVAVGVGYLDDRPNSPEPLMTTPTGVTIMTYNEKQMLSPYVEGTLGKWHSQLSYLSVTGQTDYATGSQADYIGSYLPGQLGYASAAKVDLGYGSLKGRARGLEISTSYLQGTTEDFSLWTTRANYRLNRHWTGNSQVILVSANPNSTLGTIFNQFQNNSQVSLGATYVF